MATSTRSPDRRIQRTRHLLRQAFMDLVLEKGFVATSIQDIAQRANVNRGTFYFHFADKYELLKTVTREQFRLHVASQLPPVVQWNRQTLPLLIQAVLDNFESKYRHQAHLVPVLADMAPLFERAIQEELTALVLLCLQQEEGPNRRLLVPLEAVAQVVSWAIFGPALQRSQVPMSISSEQMAQQIWLVTTEGIAHLLAHERPA